MLANQRSAFINVFIGQTAKPQESNHSKEDGDWGSSLETKIVPNTKSKIKSIICSLLQPFPVLTSFRIPYPAW